MLENKIRNPVVIFLIIIIALFWYFEKIKRVLPYGDIFYKMGLECKDSCGIKEKLEFFKKAIHYNINLAEAHYNLALVYEQMGMQAEAIESFKRVTELDHHNGLAYYKVGVYYFEKSNYDYALRYFLRADKQRGCPDDMILYLAKIYDQKGAYDLAIPYYKGMVSRHNEYAEIVYPRIIEIIDEFNIEDGIYSYLYFLRTTFQNVLADQFEAYYLGQHPGEIPEQIKRIHQVFNIPMPEDKYNLKERSF